MSRSDLEAFDGLNVITSEMDEIEVAHLLRKNANLSLMCQDCGGRRFTVQGFIPVEAEILAADHIVISHIDYQKVVVNRVLKCSHCAGTDFVTITEAEEDDGQKQSSAG
jgi:hypothetical protein